MELNLPKLWKYDCADKRMKVTWRQVKDYNNRVYFWNIFTDETAWTLPFGEKVEKSLDENLQSNPLFMKKMEQQEDEIHVVTNDDFFL